MHLAAGGASPGDTAAVFVWVVVAILAYWIPTFVAAVRGVPGKGQVVIVNLFLGWTAIGWVVALVMAFRHVPAATGEHAA